MGEENFTYSVSHKNALFIALDNYKNIHTVNQEWLDDQLASNTLPHIFVFGHEAAFKVFHADCLDDSLSARNTFWQSLSQAGVKTYFCGHDHFVDIARIDDGDGNEDNDLYQYLVGTGGGWLMSQYSNYNGENTPYSPNRIFHEMEFGYALVEVSGDGQHDCDVTITWKKRTWNSGISAYEYIGANSIQYSTCVSSNINTVQSNSYSIYPNPASEYINISGITGEVKIYNVMGIEMFSKKINDSEKINISSFQNGLYFLRNNNSIIKFEIIKDQSIK